MYISVDNI